MTRLLYGKPVAEQLYTRVDDVVGCLSVKPLLYAIGSTDMAWQQYVNSLQKSCQAHDIRFQAEFLPQYDMQLFCARLEEVATQSQPNGVLVEQPLPRHMQQFVDCVPSSVDIDCMTQQSIGNLYKGTPWVRPATAQAVLEMLDYYQIPLEGKHVVVVGRGNAVGKPLALMLLQRNATVTVCHSKTVGLADVCKQADIIVSATGKPGLVTAQFVTSNSIVIDVGLSFVDGKTCGDVAEEVLSVAAAVSPVPGGIGPVTRATLLNNLVDCAVGKWQQK